MFRSIRKPELEWLNEPRSLHVNKTWLVQLLPEVSPILSPGSGAPANNVFTFLYWLLGFRTRFYFFYNLDRTLNAGIMVPNVTGNRLSRATYPCCLIHSLVVSSKMGWLRRWKKIGSNFYFNTIRSSGIFHTIRAILELWRLVSNKWCAPWNFCFVIILLSYWNTLRFMHLHKREISFCFSKETTYWKRFSRKIRC